MPSVLDINWNETKEEADLDTIFNVENTDPNIGGRLRRFTPNGIPDLYTPKNHPQRSISPSTTSQSKTTDVLVKSQSKSDSDKKVIKMKRRKKKRPAPKPPNLPDVVERDPKAILTKPFSFRRIPNKQIWKLYRRKRAVPKGPPPPIPTSPKSTGEDGLPSNANDNNNIPQDLNGPGWDSLRKPPTPPELFETNWQALGSCIRDDPHYASVRRPPGTVPRAESIEYLKDNSSWTELQKTDVEIHPSPKPVKKTLKKRKAPAPPPPKIQTSVEISDQNIVQPTSPVVTSPATVIPSQHYTPPASITPDNPAVIPSQHYTPPASISPDNPTATNSLRAMMKSSSSPDSVSPTPQAPTPPPPPPLNPPPSAITLDGITYGAFDTVGSPANSIASSAHSRSPSPLPLPLPPPPPPLPDSGMYVTPKISDNETNNNEDSNIRSTSKRVLPSPLKGDVHSELMCAVQRRAQRIQSTPEPDGDIYLQLKSSPRSSPAGKSTTEVEDTGSKYPTVLPFSLKEDLLRTVKERSEKRSLSSTERHPKVNHEVLSSEIEQAYHKREIRRQLGTLSLRPFSLANRIQDDSSPDTPESIESGTLKKQMDNSGTKLHSSDVLLMNMSKAERKAKNLDTWVPANDLPNDEFEETPEKILTKNYDDFYKKSWGEVLQTQSLYKKNKVKSSATVGHRPKAGKMKRFQKSMRNAFGTLRKTFSSRESINELANEGWQIYPTEKFNMPPKEPFKITHIEHSPAYAFHSGKGELYLIPNFDKVLVTSDGQRIRERALSSENMPENYKPLPSLSDDVEGPIPLGHVVNVNKSTPSLKVDMERETLEEAETPFRIIQQMNATLKAEADHESDSFVSPVWQLVSCSKDHHNNSYATVRSTTSGWSDIVSPSPQKSITRTRTTSVRLLQSDDSDVCDSVPRYSKSSSFKILWRGTHDELDKEEVGYPSGDRIVEGSEGSSSASPTSRTAARPETEDVLLPSYEEFVKYRTLDTRL